MKKYITRTIGLIVLICAVAASAFAGGAKEASASHTKALDYSTLTRSDFYAKVVPVAKAEKSLVFFDFTESLGPIFKQVIIPEFEKKYGVTVKYYKVDGNVATEQVIAATKAGRAAPVDAYFVSSGTSYLQLMAAKAIAPIALNSVLPNTATIRPDTATSVSGVANGGSYVPFHMNQTGIAYDSSKVSSPQLPESIAGFLAFVKAHPKQVAVTAPTGGGSGEGFAAAVVNAFFTPAERKKLYDYSLTERQAYAWLKNAPNMSKVIGYYRELAKYAEFTKGNAATLNLIANGAAIVGTAWEDMTYTYINEGLLPKSTRMNILAPAQYGGFDGICIPATAAHKAAAMLFINEAMSKTAQIKKAEIIGSRTARTDINFDKVLPADKRVYLIPNDRYVKYAKTWYGKNFTTAIDRYITREVLAQ